MLPRLKSAIVYRWQLVATLPHRYRIARQIRELDRRGFVFISNNCIAGQLYEIARIRKASPTAGLFFEGRAFASFLEDFANGGAGAWKLVPSRLKYNRSAKCYELRISDTDALVFLHYATAQAAVEKWNSRLSRAVGRKTIIIASLRDGIRLEMLDRSREIYPHFLIASPPVTPPADELIMDPGFLRRLSRFLETRLTLKSDRNGKVNE